MRKVNIKNKHFLDYKGIVPDHVLEETMSCTSRLKGLHVIHVNATPIGGGVAEILQSLVPLMNSVGVKTEWYTIDPDIRFFGITKKLHHCLQGDSDYPTEEDIAYYLAYNQREANICANCSINADIWIIHDIQVLPLLRYLPINTPAAWICYVDTSDPDDRVKQLLFDYSVYYRKVAFSLSEYCPDSLDSTRALIFPPAIDILSPKNVIMSRNTANSILTELGIDTNRPLITQVSRFDRWKDPWGVIDAYRLVKKEVPDLQLALVGVIAAKDDPDALEILSSVIQHANNDPDIHMYSDPKETADLEVSAFQTSSDVIVQKSIREGFGLTVAEAMWKRTPVVGGDCGGIRIQIYDGITGFLASDVKSCAEKITILFSDKELAKKLAEAGRELIKDKFLMPRLVNDHLNMAAAVLSNGSCTYFTQ